MQNKIEGRAQRIDLPGHQGGQDMIHQGRQRARGCKLHGGQQQIPVCQRIHCRSHIHRCACGAILPPCRSRLQFLNIVAPSLFCMTAKARVAGLPAFPDSRWTFEGELGTVDMLGYRGMYRKQGRGSIAGAAKCVPYEAGMLSRAAMLGNSHAQCVQACRVTVAFECCCHCSEQAWQQGCCQCSVRDQNALEYLHMHLQNRPRVAE